MSPMASSRTPRAEAIAAARRSIRSRSRTRAPTVGRGAGHSSSWPPGSKDGAAARTKSASNPAASTAGSTGRGRAVSVTGISSTSAPTSPGRRAGANSRCTALFMSMPPGSPAPAVRHQCWYRTAVLNLYRIWGTAILADMVTSRDPLVGRHEELAFLRDRLADARAGSGHVVLVCGPAGIGKTRLVEELAASADGMQIGWGGAVDHAGMPPLWPWIRAVRDFPAPSTALASVAAGAAQREYSSAEDTVAATFTADTGVVDALAEQSRSGPGLLVVLDDLQWADGATLRLLERVAPEARRLPMLVVAMHRDPAGGSLPGSIAHRAEVLSLRPLTQNEAASVLSAAVGGGRPRCRAPGGRALRWQPAVPGDPGPGRGRAASRPRVLGRRRR